ncbi:MAG: DUF6478 family protein [Pseudomonadota bacterium]
MTDRFGLRDRFLFQRMMAYWSDAARDADLAELTGLRDQRQKARQMRGTIDKLLYTAESRLALPRIGANVFSKPPGSRWSWRPALWRGPVEPKGAVGLETGKLIGPGMKVFHDCNVSELTFRQLRNNREEDLAAFGLQMDVLGFEGSFLSVVIDLPPDAADGLRKRDIIRVQTHVAAERPAPIFARLNIKCGPNTEQLVQELPSETQEAAVDFDLAFADVTENRIEAMWLDLIFDEPEMNQFRIRDLTFYRYPRAEV